jgi:hypothetical protein
LEDSSSNDRTLTRAFTVKAGETWSTALAGIALDGIRPRFD